MSQLKIDDALLDAVIRGTKEGLAMTGLEPPPVGASRFYTAGRPIAVMVGLVGRTNGTCSVSMSERAMLHLASKLIGEERISIDSETVDAIGEVANMIAGRVKECLTGTEFATEHISVPSVIMGQNYSVHYARGMHVVSVDFELDDLPIACARDRFFSVTVSLLRRVSAAA